MQKICTYCRKSVGITEDLQKICRYCRKCAKIFRYCRKSADFLQIFCNTYRFSAIRAYFLQSRLFGNHGHVGAIEWILRLELARPPLAQRRLEHSFRTTLTCTTGPYGEAPWHVEVKGRVDRVDIDMDGRIHVFDYKTGKAPEPNVTLQVPLYAMCLANDFSAEPHAATYLSLRDRKAVHRDDYEKAETTLRETYRLISDGRFPPRPYHDRLCNSCGYIGLCRKETDGAAPATDVRHGTTTS